MKREELAKIITETLFKYNPYNGLFYDEMLALNKSDLKTINGCYSVVCGLCDVINELLEE